MSKFSSRKLQQIDLGDGEWVKTLTSLSFGEVAEFTSKGKEIDMVKSMLFGCIKEWNIKDEDGNIPEITEDNIMMLDVQTIDKISRVLMPLLKNNQDKKKLQESNLPANENSDLAN